MPKQTLSSVVPDTSVVIEGILSCKLEQGELSVKEVIVHEAVLAELEHQANEGKAIGFLGLDELKKLRGLAEPCEFSIVFKGQRPHASEIRHASLGEIDAVIRQLAFEEDATLLTADKVQREVGLAKGMQVEYFPMQDTSQKKLKFERFFDETTMSVHLRENVEPASKIGRPGEWQFKSLRKAVLKRDEIQDIAREILEEAKLRKDGFIEIERSGSTIVQLGSYRIVITRPSFSDGWEITLVRPVKRLELTDYQLSEKLQTRIAEHAEGILVAGSPGMGKSTFVQALAGFYASMDKVIKTVEAPRDLVLPEKVTQYAISYGSSEEVHDVLLLTRPDYTLFDEMRNTDDFKLFTDLRLSGVGMVGVVHATNPVDAIQRFIGRVEMGVIPQVIDTVLFIQNGEVAKVLSISMTVKVPAGMTEADLARPIVVITDFETDLPEYEIYSYGEQTVVVPVNDETKQKSVHKLAEKNIKQELSKFSKEIEVEVVNDHKCIVYVPEGTRAKIIGKQGSTINDLEEEFGMNIDVRTLDEFSSPPDLKKDGQDIPFEIKQKKNSLLIDLGINFQHADVDVFIDDGYFLTAKAGKTGLIKIKKTNEQGNRIMSALRKGETISVRR